MKTIIPMRCNLESRNVLIVLTLVLSGAAIASAEGPAEHNYISNYQGHRPA